MLHREIASTQVYFIIYSNFLASNTAQNFLSMDIIIALNKNKLQISIYLEGKPRLILQSLLKYLNKLRKVERGAAIEEY